VAQVAQAGEERCRVEKRRQDRHEHEVRRQLDTRQTGHEAEDQAAADEEHRHGQPPQRCRHEQGPERQQEVEEGELVVGGEVHRLRR
jgi:hypothetical protein